ncbi:hypothetical protein [Parendozoicomonas sp. Alg238-R29]|uniref:hypothetical protein n=1 Tax=Parendozoicomonas sp. Alg238-R29 TaxID=2993446 RepID=UPI00248E6A4E|nr:hypothetical protein [Parendozoicomonas sp. Alg238-R29]
MLHDDGSNYTTETGAQKYSSCTNMYCEQSLLLAVSTAALVLTLRDFIPAGEMQWLVIAAGICLQGCVILFFRGPWFEKLMGGVLLSVSVLATAGYAEYTWQSMQADKSVKRKTLASSSYQVQQLRLQVQELNNQVETLQTAASIDAGSKYQGRTIDTTNPEINRLKQERETLLQRLQQSENHTTNTAPKGVADAALSSTLEPLRWVAWLVIALVIDVAAILCLSKPKEVLKAISSTTKETAHETVAQAEQEPVDLLVERIRNGEFGHSPIHVKEMTNNYGVRHDLWKQARAKLVELGEVVNNGQRFEYVGAQAA